MHAQLAFCEDGERRTTRRRVVSLHAYARERDQAAIDVEVSDLSIDGCRIRTAAPLEPATEIWLKIPEITPRCARIRWVRDGEAGCEFEDPIDASLVEQINRSDGRHLRRRLFGV